MMRANSNITQGIICFARWRSNLIFTLRKNKRNTVISTGMKLICTSACKYGLVIKTRFSFPHI